MSIARWGALSRRIRRLIVIAAVLEGTLKVLALVDLKRRPADQIRGPKAAWALLVTAVNGLGIAPITYFRFGRRPRGPESAAPAALAR